MMYKGTLYTEVIVKLSSTSLWQGHKSWQRSLPPLQDQDDARKQGFSWLGFDWGRKGGLQARELALWVQLQREFRRRNLLGTDAIKRLEAIGFKWEPEVSHTLPCPAVSGCVQK